MTWSNRARTFWPLLAAFLLADCTTKELADTYLGSEHVPHEIFGNVVRLTLAHNPDSAMGLISLGSYTRWVLAAGALAVLWLLARLYRATPPTGRLQAAALGLVAAGALGNMSSRLASRAGVTDFIDVGVGSWRFYTFNVADVGLFCGALLLFRVLTSGKREQAASDNPH